MINLVITTLICFIGGLTISIIHSIFGKEWLRSFNQLMVAAMLPLIGFVITKVISTNFYLSLGMIGALSIVRFRTPIKSSYELTLYFSYLTLGITAGVNWLYASGLILFVCITPFFINLFNKLYPNLFKNNSLEKNYSKKILQINGEYEETYLNKLREKKKIYADQFLEFSFQKIKDKNLYAVDLLFLGDTDKDIEEFITEVQIPIESSKISIRNG